MAIENINDYAGMWANGVNIGQLWDKIKEKFVSGAHVQSDATTYPASWKQQARANIGLTIGANKMWYGSAANTIGEVTTSTFGRGLLNTTSGSEVTGLFAETAEKDKNGIEISENYAHSLTITDGYLRLKNNRYVSGTASAQDLSALQLNVKLGLLQLDNTGSAGKIPLVHIPDAILGQLTYGGNIASYQSTGNKLVVNVTTGAKAILEQRTGRTISGTTINLVNSTSARTGVDFNYEDCKGIYFIWTDNALEDHTGEEARYRQWPSNASGSTDPRYQSGDWLISVDTKWDKVDNTDAVTGVKGSNESTFRLNNVSIDALDVRALATYLTNTTQTVADKVQFNKDIWSLGGVAAYGISDLSAGGGGGGGLSGTIIRNWANYQGAETEVLGANLGMRGFRMSGYSFQVNKPAVGADNWQTEFTLQTTNIPDLPLTQITGTDDLQAIEAITETSGYLKKTAANTWALATDVVTLAGQQALTNKTYNGYTLAAACAKGVDTELTASSTSVNLPTSAAVASLISGYVKKSGDTMTGDLRTASFRSGTDSMGLFIEGEVSDGLRLQYPKTISGNSRSNYDTLLLQNGVLKFNGNKVWHAGNDGTGSGLDADLLDGYEASGLFESMVNDNDQLKIQIGNTSKSLTLDYAKKTSRMRTEIKADQEFVYRQSPQTIDADSLVINKFKGRTVVWNQLLENGDFSDGTTGWTFYQATGSVSDKIATITIGSQSGSSQMYRNMDGIVGHKYYQAVSLKASTTGKVVNRVGNQYFDVDVNSSNFVRSSTIVTCVTAGSNNLEATIQNKNLATGATFSVKDFVRFDLTLMFGAGNEPSVAEFEALYPSAYYEYNAGQLINNDAKAIETAPAGFNQWDEEWESGTYDSVNGEKLDDPTYAEGKIRSVNYIPVEPNTNYYVGKSGFIYWEYDSNRNYIQYSSSSGRTPENGLFTPTTNCRYIRFRAADTTYNNDICINISDPNRNGQYEPYKRNILPLNLDAIQVKSHNIWDEEWERGKRLNLTTGAIESNSGTSISKNYIPVFPSTAYYYQNSTWANRRIVFYDINKSFISSVDVNSNGAFTTPANAAFMLFYWLGTTYNNDICINESSSFNGQYEPHGILTINGLKQAGSVYDEIVGNKLVKRVGKKEFKGTEDGWSLQSINSYNIANFQLSILDNKDATNNICNLFQKQNSLISVTQTEGYMFGGTNEKQFFIRINSSKASTVAGFKTWLSSNNVELNYELATPIEYELASPIPDTMPAGTTERVISDRLPVTPFACDMTYGANPKDILASAVPFSRLQGVRLERGAFTMSTQNDSNWYLVTLGDKKLYLRFTVNAGAFKLEMASGNTDNPEYSKEFEFATLSTADINAICV